MKYFLFEIDDIDYALPIDSVERIDDNPQVDSLRSDEWQNNLLQTGKQKKEKRYSQIITVSYGKDSGSIEMLIDNIIDIREVFEVKPIPFPIESTETPRELLEGILILDDMPYLVLAPKGILRFSVDNG